MTESGYWGRFTRGRVSRRRALATAAGFGLGGAALSLVGCGGGESEQPSASDQSGMMHKVVETTSKAKAGGVFKSFITNDAPSMDPLTSSAFQTTGLIAYYAYPRMLRFVTTKYPDRATGASEGELAENYELSGDKLQITFKLRQGLKWDPRSPTNGRVIDAEDVVFSWKKFSTLNALSSSMAYSEKSPTAPVESVTTPDSKTIIVKLKSPDASIVPLFTSANLFYVLPREADGQFEPKGTVRGYGPWRMAEYRPSSIVVWERNPDYHIKGRPFADKVEQPIVPEYATRLSQFKAGGIWPNIGVRQEDIVSTKRDVPDLMLTQGEEYAVTPPFISFGYEGDSWFKDVRVRQALTMSIDRETMADVISNRPKFLADGLEVPIRYHTVVGAGWDGYWIDPQDEKKFGANAKFLKYNPAEAKKLMDAAGYKGQEINYYYSLGAQYGTDYTRVADMLPGMLAENGWKLKINPKEYSNDYLPNYYWSYLSKDFAAGAKKGFNGFLYGLERGYPTVAGQLAATVHKDGERFHGGSVDGKSAHLGDPKVNDAVDKIRQEFDLKKQQDLVQDLIRYMAQMCYNVPSSYAALGFNLNWPVIGNYGVHRTYNSGNTISEVTLNWWIDDTKAPLAKS